MQGPGRLLGSEGQEHGESDVPERAEDEARPEQGQEPETAGEVGSHAHAGRFYQGTGKAPGKLQ
jgi:hypothetical protein